MRVCASQQRFGVTCASNRRPGASATRTQLPAVGALRARPPVHVGLVAPPRPTDTWRRSVLSARNASSDAGLTTPSQGIAEAPSPKGSLLGCIALITGSTVGAGMLALPAVTAPAGFLPSAAGLTTTWAVLLLEALLMAEVNLSLLDGATLKGGGIITLRQMAERTLGKSAGKVVPLLYLALSYCLLVAYLAKAAEVLDFFAGQALPHPAGAAVFVAATAAIFLAGGPRTADRINQGLTSLLLALFGGIVVSGATAGGGDVMATVLGGGGGSWAAVAPAAPIMFLALVYHDLIPLICSSLGGDRKLVRSALLLGSIVPLGMFLSWEAVALSLLPSGLGGPAAVATDSLQVLLPLGQDAATTVAQLLPSATAAALPEAVPAAAALARDGVGAAVAVDPLQLFVRRAGPLVGSTVQGFSFLAVLTSFIGTVMGLSETLRTEVPSIVAGASRLLRASSSFDSWDDDWLGTEEPATSSSSSSSSTAAAAAGSACTSSDESGAAVGVVPGAGRPLALALTLGPPLVFTANNPDAFLSVLSVAGGYGMTLLYGVLPPLMAWSLRDQLQRRAAAAQAPTPTPTRNTTSPSPPQVEAPWLSTVQEPLVPGGAPVLAALLVVAVGIELTRLAADSGLVLSYLPPGAELEGAAAAVAAVTAALGLS